MYEYEFIGIDLSINSDKSDYQKVIHQYSDAGWRLVQIYEPSIAQKGHTLHIDLVFERLRNQ
ncbi:DUF4177 domain-containing protein [Cytobacillus purgationiresistens]|uniref:DUF4177 domain-containing protein n=1 Tax=Cytobacillus purgationiresistens TaxID=863449 RepID=A0ABU0ABQ9_9BACI|nr:DUF4177 domain-containing protein [Cytobacillus purgationiresistens]MDQ0268690.1 hypothetical protein [Cytobacillus purgationiresistens]